jgi:cell division septum initiation protein DivIVA
MPVDHSTDSEMGVTMEALDQHDDLAANSSDHGFRLVRRGYDPAEVQAFAAAVVDELEALRRQNTELAHRALEAEQQPRQTAAVVDESAVAAFLGEESLRLMVAVRQTAEDIKARAETAADSAIDQAQREATQILQRSNEASARIRGEAEIQADHVRREADEHSARVREQSESAASSTRLEANSYLEATRQSADRDVAKRRAEAEAEATQLVADARQQRAAILNDLASRRERALADVERLLASRRLLLDALDRVRMHSEDAHNALTMVDDDDIESATRQGAALDLEVVDSVS